ncbi:MAG: hypothetical protein K0S76_131, partial [Herbinix sp.]|nr:hypothetical protein [Herbinix sp.]
KEACSKKRRVQKRGVFKKEACSKKRRVQKRGVFLSKARPFFFIIENAILENVSLLPHHG